MNATVLEIFQMTLQTEILIIYLITISLRLWGNLSVQLLTGINPRPLEKKKRILHWLVSLFAATIMVRAFITFTVINS